MSERARQQYRGYRMVQADLIKELAIAFAVIAGLVLVLAILFSSPDQPTLTAQQVATAHPAELEATAIHILDGQNLIAAYGPPYNHGSGSVQKIGFFSPQTWAGVTLPLDAPNVFILAPLSRVAPLDPALGVALATFRAASPGQQATWETSYQDALGHAKVVNGQLLMPPSHSGPLPVLLGAYLNLAKSGALEAIINLNGRTYQTDFTRALLVLQGAPLTRVAAGQELLGPEWGQMKEPGNYPGAVWLWFYTLLYQIPPYATSSVADLLAGATVGVVTLLFMFIPWIPGLRDIPRKVKIYRLIWRDHYARHKK
ncbi:MAG: cytochrome B6 [Sulfobacillus sp.]